MQCKFITNGVALDYSGTVKPCCLFRPDSQWRQRNHVTKVDLATWHESADILELKNELAAHTWPSGCSSCERVEAQGRGDSMRLNGASAYHHIGQDQIVLELRPGNICNFACQTCWPQASTRVAQFYRQTGRDFVVADPVPWNGDWIKSIQHRLHMIVLLGGEPFYDPECVKFLDWAIKNQISCPMTLFTNGSMVDVQRLSALECPVTVVFSLDAVGTAAEYIRLGTDWHRIEQNYELCRRLPNVETRVNITTSPYNYLYLDDLIAWLSTRWPSMVTFGVAATSPNVPFMDESVFPEQSRPQVISAMQRAQHRIGGIDMAPDQRHNAINAVTTIIENLQNLSYDHSKHQTLQRFIQDMDRVKHCRIQDHCPDLARSLCIR